MNRRRSRPAHEEKEGPSLEGSLREVEFALTCRTAARGGSAALGMLCSRLSAAWYSRAEGSASLEGSSTRLQSSGISLVAIAMLRKMSKIVDKRLMCL